MKTEQQIRDLNNEKFLAGLLVGKKQKLKAALDALDKLYELGIVTAYLYNNLTDRITNKYK